MIRMPICEGRPFFDLLRLFPANQLPQSEFGGHAGGANLAVDRLKDKEEAIRNLKAQLAYLRKRMSE
jgi:hypothetical protein